MRVLFLHDNELKEPRTWTVAPGGVGVPWEGRDRLDTSGFPRPDFSVAQSDDEITVTTSELRLAIALRPFGLRWMSDGTTFASDRSTYSYQWGERTGAIRHSMARASTDRFYGLGDKTGPLDKHGRRLRTLALDALGYDAETSDPLYKHWPFMIGRDAASGIAFGLFYDTLAPVTFELGCEYDNYHGFYRYAEIDDGVLDYYLFVGPAIAKFNGEHARVLVYLKPCLLDDHPAYRDVAAGGAFVNDAATGKPCVSQFWDGEGAHVDCTHPEGIRWWQENLHNQVLDYG